MSPWYHRRNASMPFQEWRPFPPHAIVQVKNIYGESSIGPAKSFWWGHEAGNWEGIITQARRLDRARDC